MIQINKRGSYYYIKIPALYIEKDELVCVLKAAFDKLYQEKLDKLYEEHRQIKRALERLAVDIRELDRKTRQYLFRHPEMQAGYVDNITAYYTNMFI